MRVSMVGVGIMGGPMVLTLIKAGYEVSVYDLDTAKVKELEKEGAKACGTAKEAAEEAAVILLSLPSGPIVTAVVTGPGGVLEGAKAGSVIVDTSTVDADTSRNNQAKASEKGVGYIDAPILGRPHRVGLWTFPVGGSSEDLEKARPVLEKLGSNIVHIGPSGSGNILKALNNMMFAAINAATVEVMALGEKLGVDKKTFFDTVSKSGAATISNLFLELGPKIVNNEFQPNFTVKMLHKDLSIGIKMAEQANFPLLVSRGNQLVNEIAIAEGLSFEDTSAAVKIYDKIMEKNTVK